MDDFRSWLDRELANVRAQQQQAVRIVEQTVGAEKALVAAIKFLDEVKVELAVAEEALSPADITVEESSGFDSERTVESYPEPEGSFGTTTMDPASTERLVPRRFSRKQ